MTDPPHPSVARPRPYSVSGIFPSLRALATLLPVLDGVDRRRLVDLPAACLNAALDGEGRELAHRIRSEGRVEPRNVMGYWDVAARYGLLVEQSAHILRLSRRGVEAARRPAGRVMAHVAGREGLAWLLEAVARGDATLASLMPGWRAVLAGNPRFAAPASHARSLGQRVASLVHDGCLEAHGEHAARLSDEAGFRRREPEPAYATLGGGLALGPCAPDRPR